MTTYSLRIESEEETKEIPLKSLKDEKIIQATANVKEKEKVFLVENNHDSPTYKPCRKILLK